MLLLLKVNGPKCKLRLGQKKIAVFSAQVLTLIFSAYSKIVITIFGQAMLKSDLCPV
jgi:hypothetical protein